MRRFLLLVLMLTGCAGSSTAPNTPNQAAPGQAAPPPTAISAICNDPAKAEASVRAFLAAYNAGNLDGVFAAFAPGFRTYLDVPMKFTGRGNALPELRAFLQKQFDNKDALRYGPFTSKIDPVLNTKLYDVSIPQLVRGPLTANPQPTPIPNGMQLSVDCVTLKIVLVGIGVN